MYKKLCNKISVVINSIKTRCFALSQGAWISFGATIYIQSGGSLKVGRGVRVLHGSVLSILPDAILELKDGCILNHGVVIYCASRIEIGRQSRIAHYCSILDHDYDIHTGGAWFEKPKILSPISIGDNVWIGAHTVILKGVTIGDRCVIGAHTLVKKSVSDGMLAYCSSNSQLTLKKL